MRILVVEDDIPLERAIVTALNQAGHEVTSAQCLRDGMMIVRDNVDEIDLIITDVLLPTYADSPRPDGSGLEIVRDLLYRDNGAEHLKPLYVHSSDTMDHGIDIANWLKEKYPSAIFQKKDWDSEVTTQNVLDFVTGQNSM